MNDGSKLASAKNHTKSFLCCERDEQVTCIINDYSKGITGTMGGNINHMEYSNEAQGSLFLQQRRYHGTDTIDRRHAT